MSFQSLHLQSSWDRCRWYDLVMIRAIGVLVGLLGVFYLWRWGIWLLGYEKPHPRAWLDHYLAIGFPILGYAVLLMMLNRWIILLTAVILGLFSLLSLTEAIFASPTFSLSWFGLIFLPISIRLIWITSRKQNNLLSIHT